MSSEFLADTDLQNPALVSKRLDGLINAGDLDEAAALAARATELHPQSASLLRQTSEIHLRRNDLAAAGTWADRAIAANPNNAFLYAHRARIHVAESDFDAAEAALNTAVSLSPDTAVFMLRMSDLYVARKDLPNAAAWADRAIIASPDDANCYSRLAVIRIAEGEPELGAAALQRAAELDPSPGYFLRLSSVYLDLKDYRAAAEWAERAIAANPRDVQAHLRRANIAMAAGDLDRAEAEFKTATELQPGTVLFQQRIDEIAAMRLHAGAAAEERPAEAFAAPEGAEAEPEPAPPTSAIFASPEKQSVAAPREYKKRSFWKTLFGLPH